MLLHQQEVSAPSICNSELRFSLLLLLEYIHLHDFKIKNWFAALTGPPQLFKKKISAVFYRGSYEYIC